MVSFFLKIALFIITKYILYLGYCGMMQAQNFNGQTKKAMKLKKDMKGLKSYGGMTCLEKMKRQNFMGSIEIISAHLLDIN